MQNRSETISGNLKPFKMMKNAFYFILKAFFVWAHEKTA